ncbi:universal stress protein [Nitrosomonas sp. ANs5]|uniref:universal stress protein n=1 Tax=Nitrosomonas sp. ANs5 TaxID=3423941 RepID=UPI003D34BCE4
MIRRVLIPLDDTELAERAIPHLLRFVTPAQSELLLMTALPSPILAGRSHDKPAAVSGGGEWLQAVAQRLGRLGFRVNHQVLAGAPAETILSLAEEAQVDLIAMSTHGRSGLGLALLGSVADEVVRNARQPVFLAPPQAQAKPDSVPGVVLLPLDGTPLAETAIPAACQFAQLTGASVHMIRVVDPADCQDRRVDAQTAVDLNDTEHSPIVRQAVAYLERIKLRLQLAGVESCFQVALGDPVNVIPRIVQAEQADLIVMSTHGRSGVARVVHGSVAGQIINHTTCPLLLMRGKVPVEVSERDSQVALSFS